MLMNMHWPTAEGCFHDEHGNALKPAIIRDCNRHKGLYLQIGLCVMNSYSISRHTWNWTKPLFPPSETCTSEQFCYWKLLQ